MERLTEAEEQELRDPNTWDSDNEGIQEPSRPARAVVSVAFSREDYKRLAEAAAVLDKGVSTMIREIVLGNLPNAGLSRAIFAYSISRSVGDSAGMSVASGSWQPVHEDGTVVNFA